MTGRYKYNKASIYRWREKNPEVQRIYQVKHNEKRKMWCKISVIFRAILREEYVFGETKNLNRGRGRPPKNK